MEMRQSEAFAAIHLRKRDEKIDKRGLKKCEESLFFAPLMAEQERMIEAILFATVAPITVRELGLRMPHGSDPTEALLLLRKRYEGRGVQVVKVGDGMGNPNRYRPWIFDAKRNDGDT